MVINVIGRNGEMYATNRARQFVRVARNYTNYERDNEVIVIHTGLSVTVRAHVVDIVRDVINKVARVRVTAQAGACTMCDMRDVEKAAGLLAGRAQRFLGGEWTVVGWTSADGVVNGSNQAG